MNRNFFDLYYQSELLSADWLIIQKLVAGIKMKLFVWIGQYGQRHPWNHKRQNTETFLE